MRGDARRPHRRGNAAGDVAPGMAVAPLRCLSRPCRRRAPVWWGSAALLIFQPHLAAAALGQHGLPPRRWKSSYRCWMLLRDNPTEFPPPISPASWMMRICGRPCMQRCYRWRSSMTPADHARLFWPRRRSPVPLAAGASTLPAASAADAAAFSSRDAFAFSAATPVHSRGRRLARRR